MDDRLKECKRLPREMGLESMLVARARGEAWKPPDDIARRFLWMWDAGTNSSCREERGGGVLACSVGPGLFGTGLQYLTPLGVGKTGP